MKKTVGGSLMLGLALLTGCTMQTPTNLSVHEALFYGANQQRVAWVYGSLTGGSSSTKLGASAVTLRPQLSGDPLGLSGTLSVDGKSTYSGTTSATGNRVNVTRVGGQYSIQALNNLESVFATDGQAWYRLSGPVSAGQTVLATPASNNALRGAGDLTDAEADALGTQLSGKGALAVAVLPGDSLPDAPLSVEPALESGKHPLTGLYVQSGVAQAATSQPATSFPATTSPGTTSPVTTPPVASSQGVSTSGTLLGGVARQIAGGSNAAAGEFQVISAQNASALASLWNTAYGRQSSLPALPVLGTGRSAVGVFLGQRPTGGYSVSLASARIVGGVLELSLNVSAPSTGTITTQALTSPWLIAEVSGSFSRVVVKDAATGQTLN